MATAVQIALLFPLLLWLAARCRPAFAAAAVHRCTDNLWTTTFGIGYSATPISDRRPHLGAKPAS